MKIGPYSIPDFSAEPTLSKTIYQWYGWNPYYPTWSRVFGPFLTLSDANTKKDILPSDYTCVLVEENVLNGMKILDTVVGKNFIERLEKLIYYDRVLQSSIDETDRATLRTIAIVQDNEGNDNMKCIACDKQIDGDFYNPYNVTFKVYECRNEDRKMCKQCAEEFVAENNQYKGGRWEVRTVEKIDTICIVKNKSRT